MRTFHWVAIVKAHVIRAKKAIQSALVATAVVMERVCGGAVRVLVIVPTTGLARRLSCWSRDDNYVHKYWVELSYCPRRDCQQPKIDG